MFIPTSLDAALALSSSASMSSSMAFFLGPSLFLASVAAVPLAAVGAHDASPRSAARTSRSSTPGLASARFRDLYASDALLKTPVR